MSHSIRYESVALEVCGAASGPEEAEENASNIVHLFREARAGTEDDAASVVDQLARRKLRERRTDGLRTPAEFRGTDRESGWKAAVEREALRRQKPDAPAVADPISLDLRASARAIDQAGQRAEAELPAAQRRVEETRLEFEAEIERMAGEAGKRRSLAVIQRERRWAWFTKLGFAAIEALVVLFACLGFFGILDYGNPLDAPVLILCVAAGTSLSITLVLFALGSAFARALPQLSKVPVLRWLAAGGSLVLLVAVGVSLTLLRESSSRSAWDFSEQAASGGSAGLSLLLFLASVMTAVVVGMSQNRLRELNEEFAKNHQAEKQEQEEVGACQKELSEASAEVGRLAHVASRPGDIRSDFECTVLDVVLRLEHEEQAVQARVLQARTAFRILKAMTEAQRERVLDKLVALRPVPRVIQ